jgi:hypothetical protein
MKHNQKLIKMLLIFFTHTFLFCMSAPIDQEQIWAALQANVSSLKQEQKYTQALSLLRDFKKQVQSPELLAEIKFQEANLCLTHLNQLEKGFDLLKSLETSLPLHLRTKASALKSQFAKPITQKRLNRWKDLLLQHFTKHQDFPKNLSECGENTPSFLNDGYGFTFVYRLEDHPAFSGADALRLLLLSVGEDGKEGTEDDLHPETDTTLQQGITLLDTFQEEGQWIAEVSSPEKSHPQKIKEGDTFLDYQVFGITEDGVLLLKDQEPLLLRK